MSSTGGPPDVSVGIFKLNRNRLLNCLRQESRVQKGSVAVLKGGDYHQRYGTFAEIAPFRQESFFYWAFGVTEPGFYGTIDVDSGRSMLFVEKKSKTIVKRENRPSLTQLAAKYDVDEVHPGHKLPTFMRNANPTMLLILEAFNQTGDLCTIPADFEGISDFTVDREILFEAMSECRIHKTEGEIELLRYAHRISSEAHKMIMQRIRPGMYEYQIESLYSNYCLFHGNMRHAGYPNLIASGYTGAIDGYGRAWKPAVRQVKDGDMCLFDMGAEYSCFCTDLATSYPANGQFTPDQKLIYEAVLEANRAVAAKCKPGVWWPDMHLLAARVLLKGLREAGVVKGDIEDMMDVQLSSVFMTSGVGHMMGLDVVDVGGYKKGDEPYTHGPLTLRTNRKLEKGMVVTIEPGCFFNDERIDSALSDPKRSPFLCEDRINQLRHMGAIRIEDTVVVTDDGIENLVSVPRTVEEIENWMAMKKTNNCEDAANGF